MCLSMDDAAVELEELRGGWKVKVKGHVARSNVKWCPAFV